MTKILLLVTLTISTTDTTKVSPPQTQQKFLEVCLRLVSVTLDILNLTHD